MMPPLEEIRIARDAMELIIMLRVMHTKIDWACESCQLTDGLRWRIMLVVFKESIMFRTNIFINASESPRAIANAVDAFLSKF
jgi:hypothetical protein